MAAVPFVDVFAICTDCGSKVSSWWTRALPVREAELISTPRNELALRVRAPCDACESGTLEIRVEDRTARSRAAAKA